MGSSSRWRDIIANLPLSLPFETNGSHPRALLCIASLEGGGAERHAAYLADGLDRSGWDVTLAILDDGPNLRWLQGTGVRLVRIPRRNNFDPRIVSRLVDLIHRVRPQVVQAWLPLMNIAAGLAAKATGTVFIGGEQASRGGGYGTGARAVLEALTLTHCASLVVANSEAGAEYVRSRVSARVPTQVIRNAIPIKEIDESAESTSAVDGLPPEMERILFAGRFTDQKNLTVVFPALERVLAERPSAAAIVCGEGPERERWIKWVHDRGLEDRIKIPGYVTDLWSRMKSASAFLFPTLFEGQPNVVLEAMACGCPLVVSDIRTHREFLDEGSAVFVQTDDTEGIARAVLRTLDDRDAAAARATRARQIAETYTNEAMTHAYAELFTTRAAARVPVPQV